MLKKITAFAVLALSLAGIQDLNARGGDYGVYGVTPPSFAAEGNLQSAGRKFLRAYRARKEQRERADQLRQLMRERDAAVYKAVLQKQEARLKREEENLRAAEEADSLQAAELRRILGDLKAAESGSDIYSRPATPVSRRGSFMQPTLFDDQLSEARRLASMRRIPVMGHHAPKAPGGYFGAMQDRGISRYPVASSAGTFRPGSAGSNVSSDAGTPTSTHSAPTPGGQRRAAHGDRTRA